MLKIEAQSLESAYSQAAEKLSCSITQLNVEVIQVPTKGLFGLFKKPAIIVATCKNKNKTAQSADADVSFENKQMRSSSDDVSSKNKPTRLVQTDVSSKNKLTHSASENLFFEKEIKEENIELDETPVVPKPEEKPVYSKVNRTPKKKKTSKNDHASHSDIILPASFVTDQEDDYDGSDLYEDEEEIYIGEETKICDKSHDEIHQQLVNNFKSSSTQANDNFFDETHIEKTCKPSEVVLEIKEKIEKLFKNACFDIDEIKVCEYDEKTVLVEFSGKDAALLIGKEGYRYKALSYMLFNWINAAYQLQLRLEIAEFLKNQEEMVSKYLETVHENINRDGKAQTKILDGVLVKIALRELRISYPDKYVAIRSTRDGAKFIIINSFNNSKKNY